MYVYSLRYVTDFEMPWSTKSKTPWITVNKINVDDSQLAIEYLQDLFKLDSNPNLSTKEKAVARTVRDD
jgi:hypothetical protein